MANSSYNQRCPAMAVKPDAADEYAPIRLKKHTTVTKAMTSDKPMHHQAGASINQQSPTAWDWYPNETTITTEKHIKKSNPAVAHKSRSGAPRALSAPVEHGRGQRHSRGPNMAPAPTDRSSGHPARGPSNYHDGAFMSEQNHMGSRGAPMYAMDDRAYHHGYGPQEYPAYTLEESNDYWLQNGHPYTVEDSGGYFVDCSGHYAPHPYHGGYDNNGYYTDPYGAHNTAGSSWLEASTFGHPNANSTTNNTDWYPNPAYATNDLICAQPHVNRSQTSDVYNRPKTNQRQNKTHQEQDPEDYYTYIKEAHIKPSSRRQKTTTRTTSEGSFVSEDYEEVFDLTAEDIIKAEQASLRKQRSGSEKPPIPKLPCRGSASASASASAPIQQKKSGGQVPVPQAPATTSPKSSNKAACPACSAWRENANKTEPEQPKEIVKCKHVGKPCKNNQRKSDSALGHCADDRSVDTLIDEHLINPIKGPAEKPASPCPPDATGSLEQIEREEFEQMRRNLHQWQASRRRVVAQLNARTAAAVAAAPNAQKKSPSCVAD